MRLLWLFMFSAWLLVTVVTSVQAWGAYTARNWPITDGVVTAFYGTPDYSYSVGGTSHTSSYVSCNEFFTPDLFVQNSAKYAVRYPLQAKVKVHYCPGKPTLAALETTFDFRIIPALGVLALVTALCFAGFIFGWRSRVSVWP